MMNKNQHTQFLGQVKYNPQLCSTPQYLEEPMRVSRENSNGTLQIIQTKLLG